MMKTMLLLLPTSLMTTLPPLPTPSRRTSRWKFSTEATAQLFFQLHSGVGEKGEFFATGKSMNRGSFENPPSLSLTPYPAPTDMFPFPSSSQRATGGGRGEGDAQKGGGGDALDVYNHNKAFSTSSLP